MTSAGKRKLHTALSLGIAGTGGLLVCAMVLTEGEPGALPLALVVIGVVWFVIARARYRQRG
ncbi:MAG TPA: hypothetical protein VEY50_12590 [Lysobacter sp.]|nr:hypothetical protein [Lysobacter sp.]